MIKILHVDDSLNDLELAEINLTRLDPEIVIEQSCDGRDALLKILTGDYDCVLCDFQMPGMTGLELLREIKARDIRVTFIFLTGQGSEEIAAEALRAGADDYHSKEDSIAHYERLQNSLRRLVQARRDRETTRKIESALQELRQYQVLADNIGDIGWMLDPDLSIIYVSPSFKKLTGFEERDILGASVDKLLSPSSAAEINKFFSRSGKIIKSTGALGAREYNLELELRRRDGSPAWFEVMCKKIDIPTGTDYRVICLGRDVSLKKQFEAELYRVQSRLALLTSITIGITPQTPLWTIIVDTLEKTYSHFPNLAVAYLSIDEIGGIDVIHSVEPNGTRSLLELEESLNRAFDSDKLPEELMPSLEQDVLTIDELPVLGRVLRGGGVESFLCSHVQQSENHRGLLAFFASEPRAWDEHEVQTLAAVANYMSLSCKGAYERLLRVRAEYALQQSEEQYKLLFEKAADAIILFDYFSGQILQVNAAAVSLYGYSHPEFLELALIAVPQEAEFTWGPDENRHLPDSQFNFFWNRKKDCSRFAVQVLSNQISWMGRKIVCAIARARK